MGCSWWKQQANDGCFPPGVVHGLHQIVSTQRVLSGALLARWWTCLRRCAADYPRRPACSTHRSYCSPWFIVWSVGTSANRSNPAKKHLITTLRDEIRQPDQQPLRLTIPTEERLARVADALLHDVANDRTLDAWAHVAGMARRTVKSYRNQKGPRLLRQRRARSTGTGHP